MFDLKDFYQDVVKWNEFSGNSILDYSLVSVYDALVEEELKEMISGYENGDDIEYVDGLVDSLVVGSFLYAVINKTRFKEYSRQPLLIENLETEMVKLKKIFNKKNHVENIDTIINLLEDIAYASDYDILGACDEVMSSNWTKFPLKEKVSPQKEVEWIESQGRYKGVTYELKKDENGNERYVFRADTGKIVKPSTFIEPDLKDYI